VRARKENWLPKLYVAGGGHLAREARSNLERLCAQYLSGGYRIEVIDLLEDPAAAKEHGIVAVPMVVREAPVPIRKAVGDLSLAPRALFSLHLKL
jgi:circadian clock protein KaiB